VAQGVFLRKRAREKNFLEKRPRSPGRNRQFIFLLGTTNGIVQGRPDCEVKIIIGDCCGSPP
jgi:hypothetical protein